jgi:hypothetical protein
LIEIGEPLLNEALGGRAPIANLILLSSKRLELGRCGCIRFLVAQLIRRITAERPFEVDSHSLFQFLQEGRHALQLVDLLPDVSITNIKIAYLLLIISLKNTLELPECGRRPFLGIW